MPRKKKLMPVPKGVRYPNAKRGRNSPAVIARRQAVAELLIKGWRPADIGRELHIKTITVFNDRFAIMKLWQEQLADDADLLRAKEVAILDKYQKRLDKLFTDYETEGSGELAARVYDRIHRAIELRSQLQGLTMAQGDQVAAPKMAVIVNAFEQEGPRIANAATSETVGADQETDSGSEATR